jgi:hypothetical protein
MTEHAHCGATLFNRTGRILWCIDDEVKRNAAKKPTKAGKLVATT